MSFTFPLVTLEEHFTSHTVQQKNAENPDSDPYTSFPPVFMTNLLDLGDTRLTSMDRGAVSLQIISHAPNNYPLNATACVEINDELAEAVKQHPTRFAAFATLPMVDPEAAAKELKRCVTSLGFLGSLVDNNVDNRFYDDPYFGPILAAHEELDVPMYLHPTFPPSPLPSMFTGEYPTAIAKFLAQHGFGWHSEVALHFLRLFAAKIFDKYPKLKLVIGHMGEMLPFQLDRITHLSETQWPAIAANSKGEWEQPSRRLKEVWDRNIWITTSGMFSLTPMACLLRACKPERILYSVDYPFAPNELGLKFMKELEESGLVDRDTLAKIAYKNAAELMKIKGLT